MKDVRSMIPVLERNQWVILEQAKGLGHADSVLQLPFRGNCLNWVVGHIVAHRDKMLVALDEKPILNQDEAEVYARGSEPVTGMETAVSFDRLREALDQSKDALVAGLETASPELLRRIHNPERELDVGDWVVFLVWHETYHVGQLEILRQLAGTDDAVI